MLRYIHQDHLTGTAVMSSYNGTLISSIKFKPFGETRSGSVPTDKKFTGQRLDGTGLYYYGARYYDAGIGRFISADTLVQSLYDPQSLNRYSYVINNPLRYTDPSGHVPMVAPPQYPPLPPPPPPPPPLPPTGGDEDGNGGGNSGIGPSLPVAPVNPVATTPPSPSSPPTMPGVSTPAQRSVTPPPSPAPMPGTAPAAGANNGQPARVVAGVTLIVVGGFLIAVGATLVVAGAAEAAASPLAGPFAPAGLWAGLHAVFAGIQIGVVGGVSIFTGAAIIFKKED